MRLSLIFLIPLLASCGGAPEPAVVAEPSPAPTQAAPISAIAVPDEDGAAASRALLNAYLEAWNSHDAAKAASFLSDDVEMFDALLGKAQGPEAARERIIGTYMDAMPDGVWALRNEPILSDAGFSYEWNLVGVNLGNWTSYLRGKGQKINFNGISIVRIRDGRIVYQANYFDANALGLQAGW